MHITANYIYTAIEHEFLDIVLLRKDLNYSQLKMRN